MTEEEKTKSEQKTLDSSTKALPEKGPLSFLSGSLTSLLLSWTCFLLSRKIVVYFTIHSSNYSSEIASSIASGLRTLIVGMSFLATFSFGFIGLGLAIVFIRSLFNANGIEHD